MASSNFRIQNFERDNGVLIKVAWDCTKHNHTRDVGMIGLIETALKAKKGGTWSVRINSYQSDNSNSKAVYTYKGNGQLEE